VEDGWCVEVELTVALAVGVEVAWATATVAPATGRLLKAAGWPLFPLAPVTAKVKVPAALVPKLAVTV